MPPIILWSMGTVGALAFGKVLLREVRRVNAQLDAIRGDGKVERPVERLERDPQSGVYRPRKS